MGVISSAADGSFSLTTDVCVIGSGAGGGVAAALLAEGGRDVVILEEGPHVPKERLNQRETDMFPLLYRDGGNQTTTDGAVSVLQGRVLGGSTVVNMADVVEISDAIHQHWSTGFACDHYGLAALRDADEACREAIGAARIPDEQLNRNNRLLLAGGAKIGLSGGAFVHNRVNCVGSGYCLIGCSYDAKRSVAITWIPRALATGRVAVRTEARVDRLVTEGGRVVAAVGSVVDHRNGLPIAEFRVDAAHFVVAAGSIHTPVILQRSGLGGPLVGANLSLQPQAPVAAVFPDDVVYFRGIPQAAYLDSAETHSVDGGLGGYRLEGVSAPPGMTASNTHLVGEELHGFMKRYRQIAACLCLVPDRPGGSVSVDGDGRPVIQYALSGAVKAALKASIRDAARVYLAAGADAVVLPVPGIPPARTTSDLDALDGVDIEPGRTPLISAHPQGTCRMGPDPATSVVGLDLRLHGADNVHVMDASIFPTTASTHTMLPTMSYAWMAARELLTRS